MMIYLVVEASDCSEKRIPLSGPMLWKHAADAPEVLSADSRLASNSRTAAKAQGPAAVRKRHVGVRITPVKRQPPGS
jgi:hypothetical protein